MSKAWLFIVSIPFLLSVLVVNFLLTSDNLSKSELLVMLRYQAIILSLSEFILTYLKKTPRMLNSTEIRSEATSTVLKK